MFSRRRRARGRRRGGFTLTELMVALVVSATVITLAAGQATNYMRTTNTATWVAQVQHDISRFSRLLKTEVNEACLVQVNSSPSTTATAPSTPCTPPVAACSTTAGTTLFMLVPVTLVDGSVTYRVISYSRNGSELRRTGPPIAADGSLDTTQSDVSNVVVMDNLVNASSGFIPSVDSSCTTATMSVQYAVPNGGGTVSRTHVFPIGVNFTRS
jgi:prepilin-type N-terminal cleavage/methylation domain-containing protein